MKAFDLKPIRLWLLTTIVVVLCFALAGCGGDDGEDKVDDRDPLELTQEGWKEFEDFNREAALELFEEALSLCKQYADPFSGAGWSKYMMGDSDGAVEFWNDGLEKSGDISDIQTGLGFVAYDKGQWDTGISRFEEVIEANPSYSFDHHAGFDVQYLYWTIAECHYMNGSFGSAYATVQILNPVFRIDLDDGNSWDPEAKYALAQEIERLGEIVRG